MSEPIVTVDSTAVVARAYTRAAEKYDEFDLVFRQVSERLRQRLPLLAAQPKVVLDLGCGTGADIRWLRKHYSRAQVIGLDLTPAMLKPARRRTGLWRRASLVAADAQQLPFRDASIDLVLSNMMLPWCQQPHQVFQEIHRVLSPGGTVLFTTAGPDTLLEYRQLWSEPESMRRAFGLTDMHDLGDSMLSAGFSAPVLDRENITITYPSVPALETELRNTGTVNVSQQRRRGLMHPQVRNNTRRAPQGRSESGDESRFSVTLELVQGHAWKSELAVGRQTPDGEYRISMDSFRAGLGQSDSSR